MPESTRSFCSLAAFLVMAYIGLVIGANKGDMLNLQAFGGVFGSERSTKHAVKLLDTSVIIDGRVADIAEAQFLDGTIIIPQFVLHELQLVADSADPLKRQRGRRGLEVLQRIQKMPHLEVQIAEDDFAQVAEVDLKLIELAKRYDAKIVTNDFNLNKVATLQGIEILNVNQLANALKPVVLPGETMRVFILREGKEYNQGVAYLDDGTMVVVDGARKMINKTIDITVTSVHQTTAGKMIFGRCDERGEPQPSRVPSSSASTSGAAPGNSAQHHPAAVPQAAAAASSSQSAHSEGPPSCALWKARRPPAVANAPASPLPRLRPLLAPRAIDGALPFGLRERSCRFATQSRISSARPRRHPKPTHSPHRTSALHCVSLMTRIAAIIPAAGLGTRMGADHAQAISRTRRRPAHHFHAAPPRGLPGHHRLFHLHARG